MTIAALIQLQAGRPTGRTARLRVAITSTVLAASAMLSGGCATIIKGTTQTVPVATDPAGARVTIDGQPGGTTPLSVTLDRKHSHMISLELEGYEVENVAVTNSMGGAVAGNIIAGGLIGWGVDATSGAQYNLHPETVNVRLRRKGPASVPQPVIDQFSTQLAQLDQLHATKKLSDDEYTKLRTSLIQSYTSAPSPHP